MARRLDQQDRQRWFDQISRWSGIVALLVLLLGGISWLTYLATENAKQRQPLTTRNSQSPGPANSVPAASGHPVRVTVAPRAGSEPAGPIAGVPSPAPAEEPVVTNRKASVAEPITAASSGQLQPTRSVVRTGRQIADAPKPPGSAKPTGALVFSPTSIPFNAVVKTTPRQQQRRVVPDRASSPADRANGFVRIKPEAGSVRRAVGVTTLADVVDNASDTPSGGVRATQAEVAEPDPRWLPVLTPVTSLSGLVQQTHPAPVVAAVASAQPSRPASARQFRLSIMVVGSPDLSSIGLKILIAPAATWAFRCNTESAIALASIRVLCSATSVTRLTWKPIRFPRASAICTRSPWALRGCAE